MDERIRNEKILWEQEQNFLIRRELSKLNEEKSKEISKIQDELNAEKEKSMIERDKCVRLEQVRNLRRKTFMTLQFSKFFCS